MSPVAHAHILELKDDHRVRTSQIVEALKDYVLWQHSVARTKAEETRGTAERRAAQSKSKAYEKAAQVLYRCMSELQDLEL
jgi:hypothetical protein